MENTSGRKRKNGNRILICAGLLLIAAALALALYNILDARRAEQTVEQTLAALDEASGNIPEEPADVPEEGPEDPPEPPRPEPRPGNAPLPRPFPPFSDGPGCGCGD